MGVSLQFMHFSVLDNQLELIHVNSIDVPILQVLVVSAGFHRKN